MRNSFQLPTPFLKNVQSTWTSHCLLKKCRVYTNSSLWSLSSSRLVHVVKMEWGVDTNSAFCKNRWEVETNPAFLENIVGSSCRLRRGGVRVNSAFFKSRVGSSSGLRIFGEHSREFVWTPHFLKNSGEFKRIPHFWKSQWGLRVNSASFKNTVGASSRLHIL